MIQTRQESTSIRKRRYVGKRASAMLEHESLGQLSVMLSETRIRWWWMRRVRPERQEVERQYGGREVGSKSVRLIKALFELICGEQSKRPRAFGSLLRRQCRERRAELDKYELIPR